MERKKLHQNSEVVFLVELKKMWFFNKISIMGLSFQERHTYLIVGVDLIMQISPPEHSSPIALE